MIDERFDELVAELRAARPEAPPGLRERVREIAARPPAPSRRFHPRHRLVWVLTPAAAAAVAGAIAVGVLSSGDATDRTTAPETAARTAQPGPEASDASALSSAGVPAPNRGRAQLYRAEITLRIRDLSDSTKRALRLTRSLGGHVRSIEYGTGAKAGAADLVVRVPVGRVQRAIAGFTELGAIVSQHVRVRDIQPAVDRRFARIQSLRAEISTLQADPSPEATAHRERLEAELRALQRVQATARRQASFATVSLHLRTKDASALPPATPGRLGRALDRASEVLLAELEALIYVLLIGGPFVLLGAAALVAARTHRRRSAERLLA